MAEHNLALTAVIHLIYGRLRKTVSDTGRDNSGAVSIEQVLWYAAAAVSVAVVATIIWTQIKSTASTGVNTPSAP